MSAAPLQRFERDLFDEFMRDGHAIDGVQEHPRRDLRRKGLRSTVRESSIGSRGVSMFENAFTITVRLGLSG